MELPTKYQNLTLRKAPRSQISLERDRLIKLLYKALNYNYWQIMRGNPVLAPHTEAVNRILEEAVRHCESYTDLITRRAKFKEFIHKINI